MKVRGYGDETCSSKITQVSEMGAFDTLVRREPYQIDQRNYRMHQIQLGLNK